MISYVPSMLKLVRARLGKGSGADDSARMVISHPEDDLASND